MPFQHYAEILLCINHAKRTCYLLKSCLSTGKTATRMTKLLDYDFL